MRTRIARWDDANPERARLLRGDTNFGIGNFAMNSDEQPELFKLKPCVKPKRFRRNGIELPYWALPGGNYRAELADGELVEITRQSTGPAGRHRLYTNVPGFGGVQTRNIKSLLAQLAVIEQLRAANKSKQIKLKQEDDLLRMASDLARENFAELEAENAQLVSQLEMEKAENARLRDELAALKSHTSRATQRTEGFKSKILIVRPELIESVKSFSVDVKPAEARNIAMLIHQLSYLLEKGFGKDLGDERYVFGTYSELRSEYFPIWSERTLRRTCVAAKRLGLVKSKQPDGSFSRRKYYTLSPDAANLAASGKKAASKGQDGRFPDAAKKAPSSDKKENPDKKHDHEGNVTEVGHFQDIGGDLTPDRIDLLNQIDELTISESRTEHFRPLWLRRIREDQISVFQAIGETRVQKREGRIRKTIGGTLNWHYKNFHEAARKRAARKAEANKAT
jgi:hypothetical protein